MLYAVPKILRASISGSERYFSVRRVLQTQNRGLLSPRAKTSEVGKVWNFSFLVSTEFSRSSDGAWVVSRRKRGDSSVCYPEVGCFQDSGPFGYLDMLPSPPEEVSTRFFLYSGRARANSPAMDVPFSNLTAVWPWASKAFNLSAPTKVIVHGFGGSCNNVWVYEMRSALMTVVSV